MNTTSTLMIETPCPGGGRRFGVEASNSDPANCHGLGHGNWRDNLADVEIHATRTATNQRARFFLQRGYWVEVYDDVTKELLAGPFDPDRAAPAYIV
jgi:hypothetical protein